MGGHVPLGYRVLDRKLIVDEREAETVRLIFRRYLVLGSLPALQRELRQTGVLTRPRTLASGRVVGGVPFTNGPLAHLLRNRVYLGEINHKGASHPGEHEPLVARELFEAVQTRLTENRNCRGLKRTASSAPLMGRIFDDRGNPMTPSSANKGEVRYRYYVSCVLAQGRREEAGSVARVPAPEIEALVRRGLGSETDAGGDHEGRDESDRYARLERVVVRPSAVEITRRGAPSTKAGAGTLIVPWSPT